MWNLKKKKQKTKVLTYKTESQSSKTNLRFVCFFTKGEKTKFLQRKNVAGRDKLAVCH